MRNSVLNIINPIIAHASMPILLLIILLLPMSLQATCFDDQNKCIYKLHGQPKYDDPVSIRKYTLGYESLDECVDHAKKWLGRLHGFGMKSERRQGQRYYYKLSTIVTQIDVSFYSGYCDEETEKTKHTLYWQPEKTWIEKVLGY